jgi:nucleoid-associated protein YgaU
VPFKREAGEAIAAVAPETPKTEEVAAAPAADASAASEPAVTAKADKPAKAGDAAAQEVATAPALQKVDTSVIIRRGDSLWRISRRIYGRGVRYSTIYLANKDAVKNPNRIWPGQVMMIPEKTAEGEAADMAEIEKRKADTANQ